MKEYRWLVMERWAAASFLGAVALVAYARDFLTGVGALIAVCAAVASYNLLLVFSARLSLAPRTAARVTLFLDICALTAYLHYSGDIENPLMFAYSLPIVAGAMILSRRLGFFLAACASLFFFLMVSATLENRFPVHLAHHHLALDRDLNIHESIDPTRGDRSRAYVIVQTMSLAAILFGSAYGFGTLAQRIREKEAELKIENERVRLLLSILPEGVVLLERDGTIMLANRAAEVLVGAAGGRPLAALDPKLGVAARLARFAAPYDEFETNYRDRTLNHVLARGAAEGPIVWIIRDLTEQHRLMAELMHRSKMADLGLLGAGIAHEIGNPLSSISAILQLIELRHRAPDIGEQLRAVRSHVDRMSRILQGMRDFARPSAGKRRSLVFSELVEKALQIFHLHEKSRRMSVDLVSPNGTVTIEAVEDQIVQVLLNLLLNAADASGGTGALRISQAHTATEASVAIADQGCGISAESQEHLFTPFFTTKEPGKGVGLGLFISEAIVRAHGGRITVQSTAGTGSTFTVCLPRSREKQ